MRESTACSRAGALRWKIGRRLKGLPPQKTFEERCRPNVFFGPGEFHAGRRTYWFPSCRFLTFTSADSIRLGAYSSIAPGVQLLAGGEHPVAHCSTYPFWLVPEEWARMDPLTSGGGVRLSDAIIASGWVSARINVGSDVWIATNSLVLANVTIGDGAVVGAGSVVTRDVPPYAVVAGAPARVIRMRFSEATIESLLQLSWWNWPEDEVCAAVPLLQASDIDSLLRFHETWRPVGFSER